MAEVERFPGKQASSVYFLFFTLLGKRKYFADCTHTIAKIEMLMLDYPKCIDFSG
jgi:hypothetical protein